MNPEDRLKEMFDAARGEGEATDSEWRGFTRRAHRALFVRRAAVGAGALSLVAFGALGFALFGPEDRPETPAPATTPSPDATQSATPAPEEPDPEPTETALEEIHVDSSVQESWYAHEGELYWGTSSAEGAVKAEVSPPDDLVAQRAAFWLEQLLGPLPGPVSENGGITAIPEGSRLLGVERTGTELTVHLKAYFSSPRNTDEWIDLAMAQIVYTATQFDGINSVGFRWEGGADGGFAGTRLDEATASGKAFTRRDFQDFAPPIVLETPKPNAELSSGFEVAGFANVFEATVNIRLDDADGKKLAETFATATCGTGCWGDFSETLQFAVDEPQNGLLTVLTYSAEDGSPQMEASIPVRLMP